MKFLLLTSLACATALKLSAPAVESEMVNLINAKTNSWTAEVSPRFDGYTKAQVASLCGSFFSEETKLPEKESSPAEIALMDVVPAEFDSRTQWPECPMIGFARDQANCGSCWAFATTEALNDRLCIASKGSFTAFLSPQFTVNCCGLVSCFSMGCNGGQPSAAWNYFKSHGVVTGGNYEDIGSGNSCFPYQFETCAHHVTDPKRKDCASTPTGTAGSCPSACSEKGYQTAFSADGHKADSAYSLSSVAKIQADIMAYGPVSAGFTVYEDFPAYKTGVYTHVTGAALGGHAVKIIGWGTENGTDYWLVMNSWNSGWGDNGSFKIKRGTNECGIESMGVNGGLVSAPKISLPSLK